MIYPFHCDTCGGSTEVIRHFVDAGNPAYCPSCKSKMRRIWLVPQISVAVSRPSKVFGIDMANKNAVSDMKRKYNDTTGGSMIEVGNENPKFTPNLQSYDLPRGVLG